MKKENLQDLQLVYQDDPVKPNAIAFIDYEYWYYACTNNYGVNPDPVDWFENISKRYNLTEIMVFGAFGQDSLKSELSRIRAITNTIITTDNDMKYHKKDVTDFIMLDFIYQRAAETRYNEPLTYILFTGDGHFHSVAKYLRFKCNFEVIICAIKNSVSYQLQTVANELIEYYDDRASALMSHCFNWIVDNFREMLDQSDRRISPTFNNISQAVASRHQIEITIVKLALSQMIEEDYITKVEITLPDGRMTKNLLMNWDKIKESGMLVANE